MSSSTLPNYYSVLDIPPTASAGQIREAYKRAALKHHPDRVPASSPERATRTVKFQQINDAYYTLSDAGRRREYDAVRRAHRSASSASTPTSDADTAIPGSWTSDADTADGQWGTAFEEMLRDEGLAEGAAATPTGRFWGVVGGVSGGALGFIVANMPGAVAGAVAGNRLGSVRDAKGKSVYEVFRELPQAERAKLLGDLAAMVFAHAVSS